MPDDSKPAVSANVGSVLGADPVDISRQCFAGYIPNKDREGNEIGNQRKWVLELEHLLAELNGGATAMPPVEGVWKDDQSGKLIAEHPVVVYSFIRPDPFLRSLPVIAEFLHRLGRETNQGEVGFEFDDWFYRIKQFRGPTGE